MDLIAGNVTFEDEDSAKRAMVSKSQPLPPEDPAMLAGAQISSHLDSFFPPGKAGHPCIKAFKQAPAVAHSRLVVGLWQALRLVQIQAQT